MKKINVIVFIAVFIIASTVVSFAQDPGTSAKPIMGKGMMMGKEKVEKRENLPRQ